MKIETQVVRRMEEAMDGISKQISLGFNEYDATICIAVYMKESVLSRRTAGWWVWWTPTRVSCFLTQNTPIQP